jgi:hypothetical protein
MKKKRKGTQIDSKSNMLFYDRFGNEILGAIEWDSDTQLSLAY